MARGERLHFHFAYFCIYGVKTKEQEDYWSSMAIYMELKNRQEKTDSDKYQNSIPVGREGVDKDRDQGTKCPAPCKYWLHRCMSGGKLASFQT